MDNKKCSKCKKITSKELFENIIKIQDHGLNSDKDGYTNYLRIFKLCSFCREDKQKSKIIHHPNPRVF